MKTPCKYHMALCCFLATTVSLNGADIVIDSISLTNRTKPTLTWRSITGNTYRIEFKNQLDDATWQSGEPEIQASGDITTWTDPATDLPTERFYRIRLLGETPSPSGSLQFTNPGPGGGSFLMSLTMDSENPERFFIGGDIEGPFLSENGGQTYRRISGNLAGTEKSAAVYAAQMFHIDPGQPDRVYMATWGGLYRTDDEGASWEYMDLDPDYPEGELQTASVAVSPFDSNIILAGTGDVESNADGTSAIYRSADGGENWQNVGGESLFANENTVVSEFWFHPEKQGLVFAATSEGVLKSSNDGVDWSFANTGLPTGIANAPEAHGIQGVSLDGATYLYIVLRTQEINRFTAGGIWRSLDEGTTWQDVTGDLPRVLEPDPDDPADIQRAYYYWRIAIDPKDPTNVYVGTQNGSGELNGESYIAAWEDMGVYATWNALEENTTEIEWEFLMYPEAFDDPGWLFFPWWNDLHISFLGIDPQNPNILYAGSDRVYKSVDEGRTWTQSYSKTLGPDTFQGGGGLELMEPFDIAIAPSQPDVWWVGYDDMGLFRTDDAGVTWVRMDDKQQSVNLGAMDCACGLLIDPDNPAIVYQARTEGENDQPNNWPNGFVFKTTDNGETWKQIGSEMLVDGRPYMIMLPGGTPETRTIFVAIYGKGIFVSHDSGDSWTPSDAGFGEYDRTHIWNLTFDPRQNDILYAGVADASLTDDPQAGVIYRSDDGGSTWAPLGGNAPSGQIIDMAVSADGVVYAASSNVFETLRQGEGTRLGGLYRSEDRGENWGRVLATARADYVDVVPSDPNIIIAGASTKFDSIAGFKAGVYVSRDGGQSFSQETNGLSMTRLWFVKTHPSDPDQIFVGTGGAGLFHGTGLKND